MLKADHIHFIVLTHNRARLVPMTLQSVLNQTRRPAHITVVDNGSTDETAPALAPFREMGVEIIRHDTNSRDVWRGLPALARAPWIVLFHDDDLLHPSFIEHVSSAIASAGNANAVVSGMTVNERPEEIPWPSIPRPRMRRLSARQLAGRLYGGYAMPFSSVVYRVDALLRQPLWSDEFGKVYDRPLVLRVVGAGTAVQLRNRYVHYRQHAGQDSMDGATGPFASQRLALHRFYLSLLGDSPLDSPGRVFLRRNYRNLCNDFAALNDPSRRSLDRFLQEAVECGAATARSIAVGAAYARLTGIPRAIERQVRQRRGRSAGHRGPTDPTTRSDPDPVPPSPQQDRAP